MKLINVIFFECSFREVSEETFWTDFDFYDPKDNINREKGIIILYLNLDTAEVELQVQPEVQSEVQPEVQPKIQPEVQHEVDYRYSPIECYQSQKAMHQWKDQTIRELSQNPHVFYLGEVYWYLIKYNCQLVKRDSEWIVVNYPILQDFWKEVEHYRAVGIDYLLEKIKQENSSGGTGNRTNNGNMNALGTIPKPKSEPEPKPEPSYKNVLTQCLL